MARCGMLFAGGRYPEAVLDHLKKRCASLADQARFPEKRRPKWAAFAWVYNSPDPYDARAVPDGAWRDGEVPRMAFETVAHCGGTGICLWHFGAGLGIYVVRGGAPPGTEREDEMAARAKRQFHQHRTHTMIELDGSMETTLAGIAAALDDGSQDEPQVTHILRSELSVGPFCLSLDRGPEPRSGRWLAQVREALESGPVQVDWDALDEQLAAPRIEVPAFFEAFGLKGARAVAHVDFEVPLAECDAAMAQWMRGEKMAGDTLRELNALVECHGRDERLPARPIKAPVERAQRLASAHAFFTSSVGVEKAAVPERRWVARGLGDYFADDSKKLALSVLPAARRKPPSETLAALAGYAMSLLSEGAGRDSIALAYAADSTAHLARQTASALAGLATAPDEAGFTLVFSDSSATEALALKVSLKSSGGLSALAFVDASADEAKARLAFVERWFADSEHEGCWLQASADGGWISGASDGATPPRVVDEAAMAAAARTLSIRGALAALGREDAMPASGDGVVARPPQPGPPEDEQHIFDDLVARLPEEAETHGVWELLDQRYEECPGSMLDRFDEDGPTLLRVRIEGADVGTMTLYMRDLRWGEGDCDPYMAWVDGDTLWAMHHDSPDVTGVVRALARLPEGAEIAVVGENTALRWRVAG